MATYVTYGNICHLWQYMSLMAIYVIRVRYIFSWGKYAFNIACENVLGEMNDGVLIIRSAMQYCITKTNKVWHNVQNINIYLFGNYNNYAYLFITR